MNTLRTDNLDLEQIKFLLEALDCAEHWCERMAAKGEFMQHWMAEARVLAESQTCLRERYEKLTGHPPHQPQIVNGGPCHGSNSEIVINWRTSETMRI